MTVSGAVANGKVRRSRGPAWGRVVLGYWSIERTVQRLAERDPQVVCLLLQVVKLGEDGQ